MWSDPITGECEDNGGPVGSRLSRAGVGEVDDAMSGSFEGMPRSAVCGTATESGEEAGVFDLGGELDAEGSEIGRRIVLAEVSLLPCVAQMMAG